MYDLDTLRRMNDERVAQEVRMLVDLLHRWSQPSAFEVLLEDFPDEAEALSRALSRAESNVAE